MSGPIQVIPPGLLGFLQLKNSGNNPRDMPESLLMTFDVLPWYLQAKKEIVVASSTLATDSQGFQSPPSVFNVPNSEAWYVHSHLVEVTGMALATDVLQMRCVYRSETITGADCSGPNNVPFRLVPNTAIAGTYFATASQSSFFIGPGARLSVYVEASVFAASPKTITYQAEIVRLPL